MGIFSKKLTSIFNKKNYVFIFDLDGTLTKHNGRGPFDEDRVHTDHVIVPVAIVLRALNKAGYKIIFVSGRTDGCREMTERWIMQEIGMKDVPELYMRKKGDNRKDSIIKKEIYDHFIAPKYTILGCFDDRDQVCKMWTDNNIFLFNVSQGKGDF